MFGTLAVWWACLALPAAPRAAAPAGAGLFGRVRRALRLPART
jgi:hypothetical protein